MRVAGNTNCQPHSIGAPGYLRSSANGSTTRPSPRVRSRSCWPFTHAHIQRFRCRDCGARFTEPQQTPLGSHTTAIDDAVNVFALMTEGMSVRAIARVTGIHKTTILSLLKTVGEQCARLFDAKIRNVRPHYVQADEAWTFVQKKQKPHG